MSGSVRDTLPKHFTRLLTVILIVPESFNVKFPVHSVNIGKPTLVKVEVEVNPDTPSVASEGIEILLHIGDPARMFNPPTNVIFGNETEVKSGEAPKDISRWQFVRTPKVISDKTGPEMETVSSNWTSAGKEYDEHLFPVTVTGPTTVARFGMLRLLRFGLVAIVRPLQKVNVPRSSVVIMLHDSNCTIPEI
jgi:hypothetical protein